MDPQNLQRGSRSLGANPQPTNSNELESTFGVCPRRPGLASIKYFGVRSRQVGTPRFGETREAGGTLKMSSNVAKINGRYRSDEPGCELGGWSNG